MTPYRRPLPSYQPPPPRYEPRPHYIGGSKTIDTAVCFFGIACGVFHIVGSTAFIIALLLQWLGLTPVWIH